MAFFSKKNSTNKGNFKTLMMQQKHLNDVLAIIEEHDEDDAESANLDYQREGFNNQYILHNGDRVVGVTGFRQAPSTHGTAWLSWTYLDKSIQGQNHGTDFVNEIIQICRKNGCRKLFVSTSDYVDDEGYDVYASARRFYRSLGFVNELTISHYFDEDESKLIYSLELDSNQISDEPSWSATAVFVCSNTFEMLECENTFTLGFDIEATGMSSGLKDIETLIERAQSKGAQRICVGLPSDANVIKRVMIQSGFTEVGRLKDYYQKGVSENNYMLIL